MAPKACTEQPFTGNPDAVDAATSEMQQIATKLLSQASTLSGHFSAMDRWEGQAQVAFHTKVGDLPTKIEQAGKRYQTGSAALKPYSTLVRQSLKGQQALCAAAREADQRVTQYSRDLSGQRQWERNEQLRARRALVDPSLGSPITARWQGPNNVALLYQAQQDLNSYNHDFDVLKSNFDVEAVSIANNVAAAAQTFADIGGIKGFMDNRKADIKKGVKYLGEHGFDLKTISSMLGTISSLLAFAGMIPGLQFLGAIATAVVVVKLLVDLALLIAGEKSFRDFATGAVMALAPFALKGAGALVMKAGAKGPGAAVVTGNSLVGNYRLLSRAQQYQKLQSTMNYTNKAGIFVGVKNVGNALLIRGKDAVPGINAAKRVVNMANSNVVVSVAGTAYKYVDMYQKGTKVLHFVERHTLAAAGSNQ